MNQGDCVFQCEHEGKFPVLQRSSNQSETRRWGADNTDIINRGGSSNSGNRGIHSIKGGGGGNDKGGSKGAEREPNNSELHSAGGDGDGDVVRRNG